MDKDVGRVEGAIKKERHSGMEGESNGEKPIGESLLGRVAFDVRVSQSVETPQGRCWGE